MVPTIGPVSSFGLYDSVLLRTARHGRALVVFGCWSGVIELAQSQKSLLVNGIFVSSAEVTAKGLRGCIVFNLRFLALLGAMPSS